MALREANWNSSSTDSDVVEKSYTAIYVHEPAMYGVWRVRATFRGQEREIVIRPDKDYKRETELFHYLDFEEPQQLSAADSCISVNSKVDGVHVLIEVDDA